MHLLNPRGAWAFLMSRSMRLLACIILMISVTVLTGQSPVFRASHVSSDLSNLRMNEIAPLNDLYADEYGEQDDWVELYNADSLSVYLDDIYFTDDFDQPLKWKLVGPYLLQPGDFFLVWMDGDVDQGAIHASFKLKSGGEQLGMLQERDGIPVWLDSVSFGTIPHRSTLGRIEDGTGPWSLLAQASPRSTNNNGKLYLPPPTILPAGRMIESPITVEIIPPDPGCQLYYTLDGSEPTRSSIPYTGSFLIDTTLLVSAKAFKEGYSGVSSRESYLLKNTGDIAVVSLNMEPADLFDDTLGIYVRGKNGVPGHCVSYPANWNRDWERKGKITLYEPDATVAFRNGVGVKIGGGCSRGLNMKGFNLFFRDKYGEPYVDYGVFGESGIDRYYRLKLRNGGDDFQSMLFRDGLNQILLRDRLDIDLMNFRPVVLYLNAEFWGIYGLREHINQDYLRAHHNYTEDQVDLIKNPFSEWSEVKLGTDSAFTELYTYILENNLAESTAYQYVSDLIDIDEYINYHIAQIFLANYDWPAINNAVWKPKAGGKWRWILFDTDGSTNFDTYFETHPSYNSLVHATQATHDSWPNSEKSTLFLRKLFENEFFRNEFIQRTSTIMTLLFDQERVGTLTDSLSSLIDPFVEQHLRRWGTNNPDLGWGFSLGGSRSAWEKNIESYKGFFEDRPDHMLQHYSSYFQLDGTISIHLNTQPEDHGRVLAHSNLMELPYQYSGTYFRKIPIQFTAVPEEGYEFLHWEETGNTSPEIYFAGESNTTLTPLFVPALSVTGPNQTRLGVYPNPGKGLFYMDLSFFAGSILKLSVRDIRGDLIKEASIDSGGNETQIQLDLTMYPAGIYILSLGWKDQLITKKLVLTD